MIESVLARLEQTLLSTICRGSFAHHAKTMQGCLNQLHEADVSDIEFISQVIECLYASHGQMRINDLAASAGLSLRQFERRFKQLVGISPKRLARLIRFEVVRDRLLRETLLHPNNLAHEFGYTDESHFIHDFKTICGFNPNEFITLAVQRSMSGFYKTPDPRRFTIS